MLIDIVDEIRHKHRKREDKATITAPDAHIEVYLDHYGNVASSTTVQSDPVETGLERRTQVRQAPVEATGAASPYSGVTAQTGGGSTGSQISFKSGVTYSPYNADKSCKSAPQVAQDLKTLGDFDVIRLYGVSTVAPRSLHVIAH